MRNTKLALEVLLEAEHGKTTLDQQSATSIREYIEHLEVEIAEFKQKVSRRNMQIKELKKHKENLHKIINKNESFIDLEGLWNKYVKLTVNP